MALLKPGGRFLFQLNTVKDGETRSEVHASMHPSPFTREAICDWIGRYSRGFRQHYVDEPTAENEYFFMAWGRKNRRQAG
jgi:hypothetical protein